MMGQDWQQRCGDCPHCTTEPCGRLDAPGYPVVHQWRCRARFPHVEPPADCALEELNLWLAEQALPEDARDWLLAWANRRAANVIEFLAEPMKEIAGMVPDDKAQGSLKWRNPFEVARYVARMALKTCAIPRGGKNDANH